LKGPISSRAFIAAAAALIGTGGLAIYGCGWELCCGWALIAFAALSGRDLFALAAIVPLLAFPLLTESTHAPAALALAAALIAVSGIGFCGRSAALIGALLAFLGGGVGGVWPYLGILTLICVLPSRRLRMGALLAGLAVAPFAFGLPKNNRVEARILQETYRDGMVRWEGPTNLYAGSAGLILRCPEPGSVRLDLEGGGVRDSRPVGLAFSGSMGVPIGSGRDTLEVAQSGGWVLIINERDHSTGEHPVVRLHGAWSGGRP